jgi:hypothetical protein
MKSGKNGKKGLKWRQMKMKIKMKKNRGSNQPKNNTAKVHWIRMRLLTNKQDFQDLVKQIREYLHLPQQGLSFEKDRNKEYNDWHKLFAGENEKKTKEARKLLEKLEKNYKDQLKLNTEFRKWQKTAANLVANNTHRLSKFWKSKIGQKIKNEEKKWGSKLKPEIFQPEYWWQNRKIILSTIPENYLNEQIDSVIHRYSLPVSYQEIIGLYILYNEIRKPMENFVISSKRSMISKQVEPELMDEDVGQSNYITIDIFSPLTDKEIKKLTGQLREKQKECFPKGLLTKIMPQTKIETMIKSVESSKTTKRDRGQPRKEEKYFADNDYFQRLKKGGYPKEEIRKIAKQQRLAGERLDDRKQKLEKTSADIAREILGSAKKSATVRKAKLKIKRMEKKIFPLK